MKHIDKKHWKWITNLKTNRQVSETKGTYVAISDLALTEKQVKLVWLKEYGFVLVCKIVDKDGGITYLTTNDLALNGIRTNSIGAPVGRLSKCTGGSSKQPE